MAYPNTYNKVIELIKDVDRNIKIVDLGCGKGIFIDMLKDKGYTNLFYCDFKDGYDGKVNIMDLNYKFKYSNDSFDMVVAIEVIEHIENKYFFFREVNRILKNGGIFIFTTPNIYNIFNKFYFIFKNRFIEFPLRHKSMEFPDKKDSHLSRHTNPVFDWDIPKFFDIKEITYNEGFIPILRIPFFCNKIFGQTLIIKAQL